MRHLQRRVRGCNQFHLAADPAPGADVLDSAQRLLMADKDHYRQVDDLRGWSQSTGKGSVGSSRKARRHGQSAQGVCSDSARRSSTLAGRPDIPIIPRRKTTPGRPSLTELPAFPCGRGPALPFLGTLGLGPSPGPASLVGRPLSRRMQSGTVMQRSPFCFCSERASQVFRMGLPEGPGNGRGGQGKRTGRRRRHEHL